MALLPPQYLDAVVAIGTKANPDALTEWIGTGFIYGEPVPESPGHIIPFLVTNVHVIEDLTVASVKMNRLDGLEAIEYNLALRDADGSEQWTAHPDGLDVAAFPLLGQMLEEDRVSIDVLAETNTLSLERATEIGVAEGDGVFALGFPLGLTGYNNRHFVMVRQGCVARIQDWLSGHSRHVLVDALIFPGNSGGPVFLRPSSIAIKGTKTNDESFLLGMVESYIPYRDVAVSVQTQQPRVTFEENSGIALIIPGDAIIETVKFATQSLLARTTEHPSRSTD